MLLQSIISQFAADARLDRSKAEKSAGIMLSIIQQQLEPALSLAIFSRLPEAASLAMANMVVSDSWIKVFAGSAAQSNGGVLAEGCRQLYALGLTLQQTRTLGTVLLAYIKLKLGSSLVSRIRSTIIDLLESAA